MLRNLTHGLLDWIPLAQEMIKWRALVNMVKEPDDSLKSGKFIE
jgi:hypothetical protein